MKNGRPMIDNTGLRFGEWEVLRFDRVDGSSRWWCRCSCGTERSVFGFHLRNGESTSCGCVRDRLFGGRTAKRQWKHGASIDPSLKKEYTAWENMKFRCLNPKAPGFARYGGRGITICDEWANDFAAFLRDVGRAPSPKLSLDRIDNDRGYEPGNVRWADAATQAGNKQRARLVTVDGQEMCLKQACERLGINYGMVTARVQRGVPPSVALYRARP